ncbi:MAG: SUMF1/EgtB/PvdO family nonheme iron enzyme [Pseudomonadales bacterium]
MGKRSVWWLWVGGAVVVVAAYLVYDWFGTARISVTSEPTGALVRIDGRTLGETPLDNLLIAPGTHRLELQHTHYRIHDESLSVRLGDRLERHVVLDEGEGTLVLLSNPRGAWVEVDGTRLDERAPTRLTLPSGEHRVRMGLDERYPFEQMVTVKADQRVELTAELNIDPHGSVTVATRPGDARVEFPELDVRYVPGVRVPIGEQLIRVSRTGFEPQELRYKVLYGDNHLSVDLKRAYGTLQVVTDPPDATVTVSYREPGEHRARRLDYQPGMRVPAGQIEVRARAMGRRSGYRSLLLDSAGATVRLNLEPMNVAAGSTFRDALRSGSEGPLMVVIPAGSYVMGDADGPPSERPAHRVTLTQPFALSVYEITVAEYQAFAQATGRSISSKADVSNRDLPITYVDWADAAAYADWLTRETGARYRMLSEAEWEYAARAGSAGDYFFGDDPRELCRYANIADRSLKTRFREWDVVDCDDGFVRLAPVGSLAANPFGLYDVYGNAAEWVLECGVPGYARAPNDGSPADDAGGCDTHGYRGGSWDSQAAEVRSAYRNTARDPSDDRGIRLLREL